MYTILLKKRYKKILGINILKRLMNKMYKMCFKREIFT